MLIGRVLPCVESQPQTTAANSGTFMHQLTLTVSMRELQSHSIMENHRSMDYIDLLEVHHLACICTSFQHWQRTPFTYFQFCSLTFFFFKSCIKMLIGKHANLKLSKALPLSLFSLPRFHAAFGHFLTTSSNSRDVFERFRAFLNCSETRGGDIWHKETPFFHHRSKTKMTHNQTLSSYLPLSSSLRGTVVTGEEIQHESNEQI